MHFDPSTRYAARAKDVSDPSLKEVLTNPPGVISFAGGLPDVDHFVMDRIEEVSRIVAQSPYAWQYTATEGAVPLRKKLAELMCQIGVEVTWRNILVTHGSQHALDLLAKVFIEPGDPVLIESPGYIGAIQTMRSYQAQLVPVEMDQDGIVVEELTEERVRSAKFMYIVSSFSNPTGATLSASRRERLADLLASSNGLLIEDAAYHWLAYDGPAPAPIAAHDRRGHVIFVGSFSKMLLPGVRVGWIVAREPIIEQLSLFKQSADLATNTFGQLFVYTWLERYGLTPAVAAYRAKRDRTLAALNRFMPHDVEWNHPHGGFFIWVRLAHQCDAGKLLPAAHARGVSYVPGTAFGGPPNTLRLSFSQVPPGQIDEGIKRLAEVLRVGEASSPPATGQRGF